MKERIKEMLGKIIFGIKREQQVAITFIWLAALMIFAVMIVVLSVDSSAVEEPYEPLMGDVKYVLVEDDLFDRVIDLTVEPESDDRALSASMARHIVGRAMARTMIREGFEAVELDSDEIESETVVESVVISEKHESKAPVIPEPEEDVPVGSTYYVDPIASDYYTETDIIALAKMVWGEARGVGDLVLSDGRVISEDAQRAAVVWTVLNRVDGGWGDSIMEVLTAPGQFHGYSSKYPVEDYIVVVVEDVLRSWVEEKGVVFDGSDSGHDIRSGSSHGSGRVLAVDYVYFSSGGDGHNYFRNVYRGGGAAARWNWAFGDPYGG